MGRLYRLSLALKSAVWVPFPLFMLAVFTAGQALAANYPAVEDAYTQSNKSSTNFGNTRMVHVRDWSDTTSFVKFGLSGIASASDVKSAQLLVPVTDVTSAGRISVHRVWGDFDERTITHASRPGFSGELARFNVATSDRGKTVSLDVTYLVKELIRRGRYSIALTTDNASVIMGAREGGTPIRVNITTWSGGSNRAPTISGSPPGAVANSHYSFVPRASDPDGDSLRFSIRNKPPWASFSTSTGRIWGTPSEGAIGIHGAIRITVSDGTAFATLGPFDIEVVDDGNGAATLSWTPPTQNTDGSPLTDLKTYRIDVKRQYSTWERSVTINNPGLTTYVFENLEPATYIFTISAINAKGVSSAPSNKVSKTID
jgi:hypothetical protein